MEIVQRKLLTVLSGAIFGGVIDAAPCPPAAEITREMIDLAVRFDADKFLLYYFPSCIPDDLRRKLKIRYLSAVGADIRQQHALDEIESILNGAGIEFVPLKGSFLSREFYPESALRYRCDVDILLRAADAAAAHKLIAANNYQPQHEFLEYPGKHLPELRRENSNTIEVHKKLFSGGEYESSRIWEVFDSGGRIELMYAHILYHSIKGHKFANGVKTLLDIGYMLKKSPPNYRELLRLEREFYQAELLSLVLHSFPDFFPETYRSKVAPPPKEHLSLLPDLLFAEIELGVKNQAVLLMDKSVGGRGVIREFFSRVNRYGVMRLGVNYGRSRKTVCWLYGYFFVRRFLGDLYKFLYWIWSRPSVDRRRLLCNLNRLECYYAGRKK